MNKNEAILAELYIKFEWTITYKIFTFLWLAIEFCELLDNSRFHSEYNYYYYIWEIPFYDLNKFDDGLSVLNLLFGIFITIAIASLPFVIRSIYNFWVKKNKLFLSEDNLFGILYCGISKRVINIPVKKINKVFITYEFADNFRSGETLVIDYDSYSIKFHYVHNAKDFINSLERIQNRTCLI